MGLSLKGKVAEILEEVSGTSARGEWKKREFVIETTEEQYPKKVCFTLFGDKTNLIDGVKVDDSLEVHFNLESREYNGRYFHNINAWRVDRGAILPSEEPMGNSMVPPTSGEPGGEDLPF